MALVVSGERSDGFRVIDEEGFVYLRDCKKKGTTYLKCSNDVCRARGTIRAGTTQVSLSRGRRHCHAPSREEEELTRYRHDLRERAKDVSDVKRFRQIFDATSERYPKGSLKRGFPQDQQLMRRSRQTSLPPVPTDLHDLHVLLKFDPQWRDWCLALHSDKDFFYETAVAEDGCRVAVFVSPYFVDLLAAEDAELGCDATFDIRPPQPVCAQFMAVHVWETIGDDRYHYPAAYVIMESKSEASHVAAFSSINSAAGGNMRPRTGMVDFEKTVHNALKREFPGIDLSGCWFHFSNDVYSFARSHGIVDVCNESEEANKCLLKLMALPLLPPGAIADGVHIVEDDLTEMGLSQPFNPLLNHIRDFWLNDGHVGSEILSVYELSARTNNAVETGHVDLYNKVAQSRPSMWVLYTALKQYDYSRYQERLRTYDADVQTKRRRKGSSVKQDENIKAMQNSLAIGEISLQQFLARACHSVEGLQKRLRKQKL